jgi:hypothetical protein
MSPMELTDLVTPPKPPFRLNVGPPNAVTSRVFFDQEKLIVSAKDDPFLEFDNGVKFVFNRLGSFQVLDGGNHVLVSLNTSVGYKFRRMIVLTQRTVVANVNSTRGRNCEQQ